MKLKRDSKREKEKLELSLLSPYSIYLPPPLSSALMRKINRVVFLTMQPYNLAVDSPYAHQSDAGKTGSHRKESLFTTSWS